MVGYLLKNNRIFGTDLILTKPNPFMVQLDHINVGFSQMNTQNVWSKTGLYVPTNKTCPAARS